MLIRYKFLLPLVSAALFLTMVSAWLTHISTLDDLRSQLLQRAQLLSTTIQEAKEVINDNEEMRFALEEITLKTSGVYGVTFASIEPLTIWASSFHPGSNIDKYTQEMLTALTLCIEKGKFGHYYESNGDLVIIEAMNPNLKKAELTVNQPIEPSTESVMLSDSIRLLSPITVNKQNYNDVLYLRFAWDSIEQRANALFLHQTGLILISIALITLISLYLINRIILSPLKRIEHVSNRQKLGNKSIRVGTVNKDEIGVLGSSLDEMLDGLNARDHELRVVINQREEALNKQISLQNQLVQSQKIEALGQLTGGVAHDFNNMLAIILGNVDLAHLKLAQGDYKELNHYLNRIQESGNRAVKIVNQMLAFSHNSIVHDEILDLSDQLQNDLTLLRSIIPSSIKIKTHIDENLPNVLIDSTQFSQLLMNLTINARDAMHDKGEITYQLSLANLTATHCKGCYQDIEGEWIKVSVTDTGEGINETTLKHIFEPFFTTKEVGKGTGMGLSVVYGIVHRFNGHILIDTEYGKGTSFHLLLPIATEDKKVSNSKEDMTSTEAVTQSRNQHILIIDDEPELTMYIDALLASQGYTITTYNSSPDALKHFEANPNQFDLLITDQTMPELTGTDIIKRVLKLRPTLPIILSTGFNHNISLTDNQKMHVHLLDKPVRADKLIAKIASLLNQSEPQ